MPEVPYQPYPTVQPTEKATPHISVSTPAAAFGVDVGEAFANVGKNVSHVGDEIFQRALALQKLENDAAAKAAEADYTVELGKLHAKFKTLKGKDAVDAQTQYFDEIQNLRVQIGSRLGNENSKKMYDDMTRRTASQTIFNGAEYAASQNKKYLLGASQARVTAEADSFYQNPYDDVAVRRFETRAKIEAVEQGHIEGWSPQQVENASKEYISRAWLNRITGLANSEPFKAKDLLEANKGKLFGDDIRKAETIVENRGHSAGSRIISEQVLRPVYSAVEGAKEKSLEQLVAEGEKLAEKQFPGDPLMRTAVRDRITVDYNRFKTVRRDGIDRDTSTALEAITGNNPLKRRLTSVDELRTVSPQAGAAFDALPASKKRPLEAQMRDNALGKHYDTEESRERRRYLWGLAESNPDKFIDEPITGMPEQWKDELFKQKVKLLKRGEQDPRVGNALRIIQAYMPSAMPKRDVDGSTSSGQRYLNFVGAVREMMIEHETEKKKPMTPEDVKKMGAFLLQEMPNRVLPDWFTFGEPNRRFELPSKVLDEYKRKGIPEEDARVDAIKKMYRTIYQSEIAKKKAQDQMKKGPPSGE